MKEKKIIILSFLPPDGNDQSNSRDRAILTENQIDAMLMQERFVRTDRHSHIKHVWLPDTLFMILPDTFQNTH